jgi:predicted anti-sigma-YlaC factor YlaD
MKCHKIQNILLTDYADGQIAEDLRRKVDGHLSRCKACREFYAAVMAAAVAPFENAPRQDAPPDMLKNIWGAIDEKTCVPHPLWERLREWETRLFSRPSLALASMTFLFLIIVSGVRILPERFLHTINSAAGSDEEYVAYLAEYFGGWVNDDNGSGYGTVIERVFYN